MITLSHYLLLSALLFSIGMLGVLIRRNLIIILLSIELMLNAANLSFIAVSSRLADPSGQVMALFVIAIAAAEVAVGLAIAVAAFKKRGSIDPSQFELMKW